MGDVMELWNDFEACTVEGRYPLGKLVRTEGRRAWFQTQLDNPEAKPAMIVLTESLNDEDLLLERLHAAGEIHHPNVVSILAAGATNLKDTPLIYAVTEPTEENLDDVLRERPLSNEETQQLLDGLLSGLAAIHGRGLVHGRMEAANVLAAGDTIKLRSDCIHAVPRDASIEARTGDDIRGLGSILFQALTQRQPQNALDPAIQRLPSPFAQIVQRALSGLATTAEIEALIRPATSQTFSEAAKKPQPIEGPKLVPPSSFSSTTVPVASGQPSLPIEKEGEESEPAPRWRTAPAIVAAFVVLLFLVAYFVYSTFKTPESSAAPVAQVPSSSSASRTASGSSVAVPPANRSPGKENKARLAAAAGPAVQTLSGNGSWRVVAYTYNRRDQAEHKVQQIAARHADLQPSIFSAKGNRAPYLVTLGGVMDRGPALAMRDKARRLGLPRDTFARNYR